MSFTVTATQSGATDIGMSMDISVLTGQAASPVGASGTVSSTTPAVTVTPAATGSKVYASILGLQGTFSPNGSTQTKDSTAGQGLQFIAAWSSGTTTASTPITVGGTLTANSLTACALEVKSGTGLTEDASSPGAAISSNTNVVSSSFNPPAGSLLVVMVESNGNVGTVNIVMSDTSGLGLTWVEQIRASTANAGYSGIWTALIPGGGGGGATVTGVVATTALAAPAGSITAGASVSGAVATSALAAPAGSVSAGAKVTGLVATTALAAPAGAASAGGSAVVMGALATVALSAPIGSVTAGASISGVAASSALLAPAGTVSASARVLGLSAAIQLLAPAGIVGNLVMPGLDPFKLGGAVFPLDYGGLVTGTNMEDYTGNGYGGSVT